MTRAQAAWVRILFPFGWGTVTKLALAYMLSTLYFYIPVGTLYLQRRHLTYVQINSLWGIIVFTMFVTEIPTGVLADRVGHKRAVNLALGFQFLGEVVYVFARGYPGFVLAAVAGGIGFAFGSGCVEALVYDELRARGRESEITKAVGYIDAAQRLANLAAFPIGGWLVRGLAPAQFTRAIALTACAVGAGLLVSLTIRDCPRAGIPGQPLPHPAALLGDAVRLLRANASFRWLAGVFLVTVPFRDYLGSLYQPHLTRAGVPTLWFGVALAVASALNLLSARFAHALESRLGARAALGLSAAAPGALYIAMAATREPLSAMGTFWLLYGSMGLRRPILAGQLNRYIDNRSRATVLSVLSMVSGVYVALMGLLIGRIADIAVPYALAAMGVIVLAGASLVCARRAAGGEPVERHDNEATS